MNLIETKQEFRKLLKKAFKDLGGSEKLPAFLTLEDQLNSHLLEFLQSKQGAWGGYQALSSEVSIQKTLARALHLRWAYPRTEDSSLSFWLPGPKGFEKGEWASEPVLEGAQEVKSLSGIIVPALGFDQVGRRLGRGKGFYDRFLSGQGLLKVGVSLEALVVDKLPAEGHDIGMDYIITEKGVRKIGS